jgi:hypothetical protein
MKDRLRMRGFLPPEEPGAESYADDIEDDDFDEDEEES